MRYLISIPFLIPAWGIKEWPMYWGEISSCMILALILWRQQWQWSGIKLNQSNLTILVLIGILSFVQCLWNVTSLFNIVLVLTYLLMLYFTVIIATQSKTQLKEVAITIYVTSIILALLGFIQYFSIQFPVHVDLIQQIQGMQGIMGQRNLFANYIFCGVFSCVYLIQQNKLERWVGWLSLGFLSLALLLSGSRTVFLYLVLLIVLIKIDRHIWLFLGVIGLLVMIVIYTDMMPSIIKRTETFSNWQDNPRIVLAQEAIEMFLRNPIFGQGMLEFNYGMWMSGLDRPVVIFERHSHNLVLQILAETGLFGLTITAYWIRQTARKINWNHAAMPLKGIIGVQLIHSMVEFPLWYMQWLCLFGVCIGLAMRQSND